MKKEYPLKLTYLMQDHLLSLLLKMSKTLQTNKVLFHQYTSQPPSQRYDFENNNRRNPGNEVHKLIYDHLLLQQKQKKSCLRYHVFE